MIAKSTTSSSFRGLANYLEGEQKIEFKEAHNLAGDHKDHYVRMMEDTASMSKAEQPVYHVSLSYSPEDNPSKDMMIEDGHQRSEEHTSELQSRGHLVCRLLLEKKNTHKSTTDVTHGLAN